MWFIVLAVFGVMIDNVNYNEIIALHKYLVDNLLSLFIINFRYKIHYCLSFLVLNFRFNPFISKDRFISNCFSTQDCSCFKDLTKIRLD